MSTERFRDGGETTATFNNFRDTWSQQFYPDGFAAEEIEWGRQHSSTDMITRSRYSNDVIGSRGTDNPLLLFNQYSRPVSWVSTDKAKIHVGLDGSYDIWRTRIEHASDFVGAWLNDDDYVDDVEFITRAAAETNPSSAQVQGLVFMAELRDLTSLVQSTGETLSKFGANEYLKFQYGWRPLVKDVKKLFDVVSKIRKRMLLLQRLQSRGLIKTNYNPPATAGGMTTRRVTQRDPYHLIPSKAGDYVFDVTTSLKVRRWAQLTWTVEPPEHGFNRPSDDKHYETARNAVYGLNLDGPSLWQAMPWSWLIDWTANCSDYIESQNNTVGGKLSKTLLMKDSLVVETAEVVFEPHWRSIGPNTLNASVGSRITRKKERLTTIKPGIVRTGGVDTILGSDFKTSILGALGIQRLRRVKT